MSKVKYILIAGLTLSVFFIVRYNSGVTPGLEGASSLRQDVGNKEHDAHKGVEGEAEENDNFLQALKDASDTARKENIIHVESTEKQQAQSVTVEHVDKHTTAQVENIEPPPTSDLLSSLHELSENKQVDTTRNFPFSGSNNGGAKTDDVAEPSPSPSATEGLPWVYGMPRGYAMLYAMHPKARGVVEGQVENLLRARIRDVYISVLIDGTFSYDAGYVKSIVSRLSADRERSLVLALYVTNGPTMRLWDQTPIRTDFSQIEPSEFRRKIKWNDDTKAKFKALVLKAKDIFDFNIRINSENRNIVFPMLEDNLDRSTFFVMKNQIVNELGNLATVMRNPCSHCYANNDDDRVGSHLEVHELQHFDKLGAQDAFVFDGLGFSYPERAIAKALSVSQAKTIMNVGLQRGFTHIGLWQKHWQGIDDGTGTLVHPDRRNYIASTAIELAYERELLREGLSEEVE